MITLMNVWLDVQLLHEVLNDAYCTIMTVKRIWMIQMDELEGVGVYSGYSGGRKLVCSI